MKQKIVLADDHQLLAEGIKPIIEEIENTEIIHIANSGTELLSFLNRNSADLVILDLNIPGQDGLKCLGIIKRHYPSVKVLVLTSYNQAELISEVKKLQADGYMVKSSSSSELKEGITKVLNGSICFPEPVKEQVVNGASYYIDDFLKKFHLTKREVDIIRLICREMSSKQIAAALFLSEFTVNTHRKNIFRKLDVKNVAGLMNFAKENGLT